MAYSSGKSGRAGYGGVGYSGVRYNAGKAGRNAGNYPLVMAGNAGMPGYGNMAMPEGTYPFSDANMMPLGQYSSGMPLYGNGMSLGQEGNLALIVQTTTIAVYTPGMNYGMANKGGSKTQQTKNTQMYSPMAALGGNSIDSLLDNSNPLPYNRMGGYNGIDGIGGYGGIGRHDKKEGYNKIGGVIAPQMYGQGMAGYDSLGKQIPYTGNLSDPSHMAAYNADAGQMFPKNSPSTPGSDDKKIELMKESPKARYEEMKRQEEAKKR